MRRAQGAVEYGLLIAVVAIVTLVAGVTIGPTIRTWLQVLVESRHHWWHAVTPRQLLAIVIRIPVDVATRQRLLRAAMVGQRWALFLVKLHAWRQRQAAPSSNTWLARLWARLWR